MKKKNSNHRDLIDRCCTSLPQRQDFSGTISHLHERLHDRYSAADDDFPLDGLFQNRIIRGALFRAGTVFGFGCFVEFTQYLGRPIFGSRFDPLDILAYAGGVLLGVLLDLVLFPCIIPLWNDA